MSVAKKLIRLRETLEQSGLSKSGMYARIQRGEFPQPCHLGLRRSAWVEEEVQAWIAEQIAERDMQARIAAAKAAHRAAREEVTA